MVAEINNVNAPAPGKPRNGGGDAVDNNTVGSRGAAASPATTAGSSSSSDTVELSSQAQQLSRIQQDLQALPEVDAARVSEMREQISRGEYLVDAQAIAAKIIASEQNFGI